MLKKTIVLLLFLIPGIAIFAQDFGTVKGIVKDSTGAGVDIVSIVIEENQQYETITDSKGAFELKIPANQKLTLVFSSINIHAARRTVEVLPGKTIVIHQIVDSKQHTFKPVTISKNREETNVPSTAPVEVQPFGPSPNESFESTLAAQALGVSKTNELSSTYSVRGGNFDENLVYVNDFEIYRPYLIRSAEQEGLSFVNPDMVDNVKFSSGGFQARYGDKMSSVMDVTYRRPDSLRGSVYASLLGLGGHLEGTDKKRRLTYSVGVRQRLSQYILGSLDTKGEYSPNYLDVQGLITYVISEKLSVEALVNYSRNQFNFVPVNRQTTFGLLTDVKNLTVYYDGEEADQYQSATNGLAFTYRPNNDLRIKFLSSYVLDREKENYDIIGQYFLSEVNSDLGSKNFGQTLYSLGTGGLQDWARNTLNVDIFSAGMRGSWFKKSHNLQWGLDYKHEIVSDKISEWNRLDSAGYSLPYNYNITLDSSGNVVYPKSEVDLNRVVKSSLDLNSNRVAGFIQDTWKFGDSAHFTFNYGVRFEYWDVNKEPVITPRVQFSYKPKGRADLVFTTAAGLYYQPPFYREMRNDFTGAVNTSLKAQKSFHAVAGLNYSFLAWHRNFNFTTEVYYKTMWDLIPYQYNDVLIQYLGANSGKGYAYGIDMRLNGELAKGVQSWISMSIMQAMQNIAGDDYTAYYDSTHHQIAYNQDNLPLIRDSAHIKPGKFPLPTDQRVNFNMYFQDYIPQFPFIKLHINLVFATGLPFGAPGSNFYTDVLRTPPYRRADIGTSAQLWKPNWAKHKNKFNQGLKGVWLSLDVFNIFGISNVVSYLWVRDASGAQYAVPNYLTSRRVNLKLLINF